MTKAVIARYPFIDKVTGGERAIGECFEVADERADELVSAGVADYAKEQPKPKRTRRTKKAE